MPMTLAAGGHHRECDDGGGRRTPGDWATPASRPTTTERSTSADRLSAIVDAAYFSAADAGWSDRPDGVRGDNRRHSRQMTGPIHRPRHDLSANGSGQDSIGGDGGAGTAANST